MHVRLDYAEKSDPVRRQQLAAILADLIKIYCR
jgi:hypothetical protein